MSHDAPKTCLSCSLPIASHVDEVYLWEHVFIPRQMVDTWRQPGPMHEGCAAATIDDDDTRWSRTEPDQEPTQADFDRMAETAYDSDTRYREELRNAGRSHLLS